MRGRKPRYHEYELRRMGVREIKKLAKELGVRMDGAVDKGDVVEGILRSEKIDVIHVNPGGREYSMGELESMKIRQLKEVIKNAGVKYREEDVVERRDLINILVNSGRVNIVQDEDEIMGIDDDEGEGNREEGKGEWVDLGVEGKGGEEEEGEEEEGEEEEGEEGKREEGKREESKKREREDSGEGKLGSTGIRREELAGMSVGGLKRMCMENGIDVTSVVEKGELVSRIVNSGVVLIADF